MILHSMSLLDHPSILPLCRSWVPSCTGEGVGLLASSWAPCRSSPRWLCPPWRWGRLQCQVPLGRSETSGRWPPSSRCERVIAPGTFLPVLYCLMSKKKWKATPDELTKWLGFYTTRFTILNKHTVLYSLYQQVNISKFTVKVPLHLPNA